MHVRLTTTTVALACGAATLGQSMNIDIDRTTGPGANPPSSSFGAAANQPGTWNSVAAGSSGTTNLVELNGSNAFVTATLGGNGSAMGQSAPGASVDYGRLMWDYNQGFTQNGVSRITLNGLDPGVYRVYVYAFLPAEQGYYFDGVGLKTFHTNWISVKVGASNVAFQIIEGEVSNGAFVDGVTHATLNIVVPNGSPAVEISVACDAAYGLAKCALNGVQLVKYLTSRIYVDEAATAGGDSGASWSNAFLELTEALSLADVADGLIQEIWVANGEYSPSPSNRASSFRLQNNLKILGGFAGGETSADDRDPYNVRAYLSGSIGASGSADNSYNVVAADGVNSTAVLDGFWISSGNANQGGGGSIAGGGLKCVNGAQPRIRNCVFVGNTGLDGGAVMVTQSAPLFSNVLFINNTCAGFGGAVVMYSGTGTPLRFYNCEFINNNASAEGGALYVADATQLTNCVLNGNSAGDGVGGAYMGGSNDLHSLTNCTIAQNHSSTGVGGIYFATSTTTVNNSIFWGNTSGINYPLQDKQFFTSIATVNFARSCVQTDALNPVPGVGNIKLNPQFVDANGENNSVGDLDDDLRLTAASPAVDSADASKMPQDAGDIDGDGNVVETMHWDLDLRPRRVNVASAPDTGPGQAPMIDMGAYETQQTLKGDMNCDGVVNFADIDPFVAALTGEPGYLDAYPTCFWLNGDTDGNNTVNFSDIDPFVALLGG